MKLTEEDTPDLLSAAKFMIDTLADLTTEEFSRGGDKEAREALTAAIMAEEERAK